MYDLSDPFTPYSYGVSYPRSPEKVVPRAKIRASCWNLLFRSHMQDLQEVTHDLHYENYRATRLADGSDSDGPGNFITKISFIIVTINLKVWTNHVQLYQNQIQISSWEKRKLNWLVCKQCCYKCNNSSNNKIKLRPRLHHTTSKLQFGAGPNNPCPCIKLPKLCEIAPKFKKKWSKLYSKMYIGSRSLMLY